LVLFFSLGEITNYGYTTLCGIGVGQNSILALICERPLTVTCGNSNLRLDLRRDIKDLRFNDSTLDLKYLRIDARLAINT